MKSINIGRGPGNDVVLNNQKVSRRHCCIYAKGSEYYIADLGSKNGTFVNGQRITGEHRLNDNDKVTVGSERIPWQSYVNRYLAGTCSDMRGPSRRKDGTGDWYVYDNIPSYNSIPSSSSSSVCNDARPYGLGLVALLLSIAGAVLVIIAAVKIWKWGGFALLGNASTFVVLSVVCEIIAWILALIANANDYKDSGLADIAEYIASVILFLVIAFFIYVRFIDSNALNPFSFLTWLS